MKPIFAFAQIEKFCMRLWALFERALPSCLSVCPQRLISKGVLTLSGMSVGHRLARARNDIYQIITVTPQLVSCCSQEANQDLV